MKADELIARLRQRYSKTAGEPGTPAYACFDEFIFDDKFGLGRIDFVAFALWDSFDFIRRAFEIKVSRFDFLAETANPQKSRAAREYFHEFYIVAPKGLFDVSELPEGVGWMYPTTRGLRIGLKATFNVHPRSDDRFVAMCCRRAFRTLEARSKDEQPKTNV